MKIDIIIDKETFRKTNARLQNILDRVDDFSPIWAEITAYMQGKISLQFVDNRAGRATVRSSFWPWFAPQYTRKDGTMVPAEGGISRLDGKGLVLGRLRDSTKQRISADSNLMRNTGIMFGSLLNSPVKTKKSLKLLSGDKSEKLSYQNRLRPFLYFEDDVDTEIIGQLAIRHVIGGEDG